MGQLAAAGGCVRGDDEPSAGGAEIRRDALSTSKRLADSEGQSSHLGFSRSAFAQVKRGKIQEGYDIREELGAGSYGIVSKARHRRNGCLFAVKTIPKAKIKDTQKVKEEFNVIRQLDHPHICKAYECYEDRHNIYLVMELLTGGTLMETLCSQKKFTEADVAGIMRQILGALAYLHEANFIFRDLKTENVMFRAATSPEGDSEVSRREVKLIDFGLCCFLEKGSKMCRAAGTPYSVAPELLTSPVQYDQKCDAWSAGIVMYIMLSGKYPFSAKTKEELLNKIKREPCNFTHPIWKRISKDAKTLLAELMRKRVEQRVTVVEALQHPWLARGTTNLPSEDFMEDVVESFKHFQNLNTFQKAAVTALAWRASDEETKSLREIFSALDTDGNGHITVQELRDALVQTGVSIPEDLVEMCMQADTDGGGTIEYTEFLAATLDKQEMIRDEVVREAFRVFDQDGSGTITKRELLKILSGSPGERIRQMHGNPAVDSILSEYDVTGDAVIDFEEFMDMLNRVKESFQDTVVLASARRNSKRRTTSGSPNASPRTRQERSRAGLEQHAVEPPTATQNTRSEDCGYFSFCACTQMVRAPPASTASPRPMYRRSPSAAASPRYNSCGSPRIGIGAPTNGTSSSSIPPRWDSESKSTRRTTKSTPATVAEECCSTKASPRDGLPRTGSLRTSASPRGARAGSSASPRRATKSVSVAPPGEAACSPRASRTDGSPRASSPRASSPRASSPRASSPRASSPRLTKSGSRGASPTSARSASKHHTHAAKDSPKLSPRSARKHRTVDEGAVKRSGSNGPRA